MSCESSAYLCSITSFLTRVYFGIYFIQRVSTQIDLRRRIMIIGVNSWSFLHKKAVRGRSYDYTQCIYFMEKL